MIRDLLKQLKLLVNLRKHDGILSIEDALRCCFRKRDLDSLINQLCDRRQLLEATAASAGLSEQDLLKYLGFRGTVGLQPLGLFHDPREWYPRGDYDDVAKEYGVNELNTSHGIRLKDEYSKQSF